ncbi:14a114be-41ec-4cca-b830-27097c1e630b [Sclerotinia trifoliorum]|uniref:14a114be-41ec-4cca-b830-27097c1e630b n=1 Tax=Sclerotinia trifoliorum TaxID=28548 RepID=A0A8H2VYN4_9HELO|nr:14a114be-41ec-4cca-b830-27097c1e630b [Sclerotinia trifoliorum]
MLGRIFYPALLPRPPLSSPPSSSSSLISSTKTQKFTTSQIATILLTLSTISSLLLSSTYLPLIERYICNTYTPSSSSIPSLPTASTKYLGGEEQCRSSVLQVRTAEINRTFQFLCYLPGILLTEFWGWIAGRYWASGKQLPWQSPLHGRKLVVMMAAGSSVVAGCWWGFICWNSDTWDIRWIYIIPLFDLFGGGHVIMTSLLYTYVSEGVTGESNDRNGKLSSTLYRLVSLQLFSSFKALLLADFLLKYEWGIWVICALAIGCRAIAVGLTTFLPSRKVIDSFTDIGRDGGNADAERERYRDFISSSEDNGSVASIKSRHPDTSFSLSINTNHMPPPPPPPPPQPHHEFKTLLLLFLFFLVTLSLRIHIFYPQFTNLSQDLSHDITTTIYSFCLLGASILLYILPQIQEYTQRKRNLWMIFMGNQENEDPDRRIQSQVEGIEGIERKGGNDLNILRWCLIANITSLILLALPTTKGVVFWMAVGASVAGSPVQVALMALGTGLLSSRGSSTSSNVFSDEACGREGDFLSTRRVLGDVDAGVDSEVGAINVNGKGKGEGRSEMEKLYVRMGMIEQVGACLATGVWTLGFPMGIGGNDDGNYGTDDGLVDFENWEFLGWMGKRGGVLLAAGLIGSGFVVLRRLEGRKNANGDEEGRIMLL